ncbi:MAG: hypothetical protein CTY19_12345 [Methylomonas sp.]|nr:MAG: hypothetical protein CTY19_12345 [Methylomonas sp.]
MNNKARILLVEDDDFAAEVTIASLADEYEVQHVNNGKAALDALSIQVHDLVLMDVSLPGMSGYEICRTMRNDMDLIELPIIFLSGMVSDEDRLAGYEAGGDDYLTKPVPVGELRTKIAKFLARKLEREHLKADLSTAFSTAMTAMSSAAEVGSILQFLRTSFNCSDYTTLCRELLNTTESLGVDARVQIRGQLGVVSFSPSGICSPLEENALTTMSEQGRLFSFGSHTSCTYDHVTIIVKNMPNKDPDRYGRLKDNLALLAEGADARVVALDDQINLCKQHNALTSLISTSRETLVEIERNRQTQQTKNSLILENFRQQLEHSFLTLGLTESQEEELIELAQSASEQALALYDENLAVEERMKKLLKQLERASQ